MTDQSPDGQHDSAGVTVHVSRRALVVSGLVVAALALAAAAFGIGALTAARSTQRVTQSAAAKHRATVPKGKPRASVAPTTAPAPSTTTLAPTTTTEPPPTTTTAPTPIPLVTNCGSAPTYEPASLFWCTSLCSSYMTDIAWSTWGPNSATGTGTYVTKTTTPRTGETFVPCSTATPIHHPGTPAVLSDPQYETVCPAGASARRVLVFTRASWWTESTYALVPPLSCT
jgi:hypothetical protein